jgi:hypothetical protein
MFYDKHLTADEQSGCHISSASLKALQSRGYVRMPQSKLSFFRNRLGQTENYRTPVSLYSHTNHSSPTTVEECAISTLWKTPPVFIELIFSALSLLENTLVHGAMKQVMKDEAHAQVAQIGHEAAL